MSGMGSMALNMTHPSPLDENRLEYRIHLTPDLLPEMEELLVPGPLQKEIKVQVRRGNLTKLFTWLCATVIVILFCFFLTVDLSQIWKRIWRKNKSKH